MNPSGCLFGSPPVLRQPSVPNLRTESRCWGIHMYTYSIQGSCLAAAAPERLRYDTTRYDTQTVRERNNKNISRPLPSIPVFNRPVQARGNHLARLLGMPLRARDRPVAGQDLMQHLGALPVVEADEAAGIACHDEGTVRRNVHVDGVPRAIVALEHLLAVLPEAVCGGVDDDLIVARLEGDRFA